MGGNANRSNRRDAHCRRTEPEARTLQGNWGESGKCAEKESALETEV